MSKVISSHKINESTTISEVLNKGFWLYDKNVRMNISMRAKTKEAALIEALEYYQRVLTDYKEVVANQKERLDYIRGAFTSCDECEDD